MMLVDIRSSSAFSHLYVALNPGEALFATPGALVGYETGLEVRTVLAEGRWQSTAKRCLGNPLLQLARLRNTRDATRRLILSPATPGPLAILDMDNQYFWVQHDVFLACTPGVVLSDQLQTHRTFETENRWFQRVVGGRGRVWLSTFGALAEKELDGEMVLDSGFLVACERGITRCRKRRPRIPDGMVRIRGRGKVLMQSRSCAALSRWLNPDR